MFPRRIVLLVLLVASVAGAFDLPPGTYPFRTYGRDAGLGNLSVTRLAQDSVGFIWVATQEGIYRYDGSRFTRFGLEEGLTSTFVPLLVAGPRGELWAGTGAGVIRWNGSRFEPERSLPRTAANAIAIDANGRLWAAMPEGLFAAGARVDGWSGEATAVWCDGADTWAAAIGTIGRLSRGAWTWWSVPRERIDAIVVDRERRVWARSGNHLFGSDGTGAFRDEQSALPATSNNGYLSLDARGNLWVPTDRGLAIHERGAWRVIGSDEGLPTEWARHVIEDREGSIWVASLGVHRLLGRGELVSYKRADGLPNEVIWCFLRERDGHLLVGTDLGLTRASATGWSMVAGTNGLQVRSVVDDDGVLWTGGTPAEIVRIDGANVRRYGEAQGVVARTIMHILRDRGGAIWAATRGGGLLRKAPSDERFVRVDVSLGDAAEDFRYVIEDSRGRIWATGRNGLACLADGRWRRYTKKDGLADEHVSYLMETSAGDFWVTYFEPHGIVRIRANGDGTIRIVQKLDTASGIAANKAYIVGEDKSHRLWVGTGVGIDVIGMSSIEHYSTVDGLAGDDTDAMAFLCDENGHVFVGTSSGFSHYVPRSDTPRVEPPAVRITSSQLGGTRKRDFDTTFSALSYFKPDNIEYEVRLTGLEDAWQRVTEPRARWTNLPPGEYRLDVRARLRPGAWSKPASAGFAIAPAWWQTLWARAIGVALLALLLWLAYRWRVAMLHYRATQLETLVLQRTRELEEISITDALTGMKNRHYLEHCMPEYTSESLRRHEVLTRAGQDPTDADADLLFFLIDLDWFKDVNDHHGHLVGDAVLVAVGALLRSLLRESDTLVRWGGEEFLFIARHASRSEGQAIAERIRTAIEGHELVTSNGLPLRLTCSIGFAAYPFVPDDRTQFGWYDVVDVADMCLYAAKRAGRNCWVGVATRNVTSSETLLVRMRESVREVIDADELVAVSSRGALQWDGRAVEAYGP